MTGAGTSLPTSQAVMRRGAFIGQRLTVDRLVRGEYPLTLEAVRARPSLDVVTRGKEKDRHRRPWPAMGEAPARCSSSGSSGMLRLGKKGKLKVNQEKRALDALKGRICFMGYGWSLVPALGGAVAG